jgi:hypothetical protein
MKLMKQNDIYFLNMNLILTIILFCFIEHIFKSIHKTKLNDISLKFLSTNIINFLQIRLTGSIHALYPYYLTNVKK